MKPSIIQQIIAFFFLLCPVASYAQEGVMPAGGEASGPTGQVSFSVGQLFYILQTGHNGSVLLGVQQPFEISVVTSVAGYEGINLLATAYPNPARDHLMLKIDNMETALAGSPGNLSYQLIDLNGKMLQHSRIIDSETRLDVSQLLPATYFLRIIDGMTEVRTFRIIKIQ